MAKNFQTDNMKYKKSRTDIYNSNFNSTVSSRGVKESDNFLKNLDKYCDFVSWCRWNPDLFLDLITPEKGGIRLDLDQRVFLRSLFRFISTYGVFPRGYGKTFIEVLGMYLSCIFFPDIDLSMTAQTRENASKLVEEKHREILKFYPLMANEIVKSNFSKDSVEIIFTSGGRIDIMANQQSSKGARRKRINIEESALLNNALFQDVLEPIVNIPRRTIGKKALVNPEELNGSINFFTTSGFRGSDEFERNLKMVDEMAELKGKMVLGSSWELACEYGRGETKSQLLDKKEKLSPIFFAMNYESRWVGAVDNALVDINKLMELRTISQPEIKGDGKSDYYVCMDVARSQKESNNQSSIVVLKVIRNNKDKRINVIKLVNLINLPNGLNFTSQAIQFKRIFKIYNAKVAICDENGLGKGLVDELLKEQYDSITSETLECWNTINTDNTPDDKNAPKCLYALHSQGINTDIIVNFIDIIESKKLEILEKHQGSYDINNTEFIQNNVMPKLQTDFLIEEISNLKLKHLQGGKLTVEQVTRRVDKDRFSALSYCLWYIKNFEDKSKETKQVDFSQLFQFKKPQIRKI